MPLALAGEIVSSPEFDGAGWEETLARLYAVACEAALEQELSRSDRIYLLSPA